MTIDDISRQIRDYHEDVKTRVDALELAIHGRPEDELCPGLNVQVKALLAFRERVRLGLGAAWALMAAAIPVLWRRG